jgi:peroxiredoxin Q/BCP
MLEAGQKAPEFDLPADGGGRVRLADLKGRPLVLYFYPKDDTSGCTKEALDFAGSHREFAAAGVTIVGVSKDSVATVVEAYGSWVEKSMYGKTYMGIERSTFLIDGQGTVRKVWRKVQVPGHVDAVVAAARSLN